MGAKEWRGKDRLTPDEAEAEADKDCDIDFEAEAEAEAEEEEADEEEEAVLQSQSWFCEWISPVSQSHLSLMPSLSHICFTSTST